MNASFSLASLKPSPAQSAGSGLPMRGRTEPANDAFGQLLESAVAGPPARNFAPRQVEQTRTEQHTDVEEHREPEKRSDRARSRTRSHRTERDDNLAGACAVTAQPAPPDHTPEVQSATATEDNSKADAIETATTSDAAVEGGLSAASEEGSKIANGKMLTTKAGTLAEMLTPTSPESADIKAPPELTPTRTTDLEALSAEQAPATEQADVAMTDATAPATPTQSALQAELQSQKSDESSAADAVPNGVLPDSANVASAEPDDGRRSARAARRAWVESLESPRGMATAQMSQAMKTTTKVAETAGRTEQLLPSAQPNSVPPLPKLAAEAARASAIEISAEDIAAAKLSPSPVRADVSETKSVETRSLAPMGRISDIISREVRLFKRAADDLVEVVLTPDARTQISLRLQWREGQVEAQARCDLGDYKALNTQWPQLQAALASQGVRLSHLSERVQSGFTDFFSQPNFAQSSGSGNSGRGAREPEVRSQESAVRPPASGQRSEASGQAPVRQAAAARRRLLESWA